MCVSFLGPSTQAFFLFLVALMRGTCAFIRLVRSPPLTCEVLQKGDRTVAPHICCVCSVGRRVPCTLHLDLMTLAAWALST